MTQNEKLDLQRRTYFRNRMSGFQDYPVKLLFVTLYLVGAVYVLFKQSAFRTLAENTPLISPILKTAMEHTLLAYLLLGCVALAVLMVYPSAEKRRKTNCRASA